MRLSLLLVLVLPGTVFAHDEVYVDMSATDGANISYAYADVVRANPTYESITAAAAQEECGAGATNDEAVVQEPAHVLALGLASEPRRECGTDSGAREERRISGYDVEYRYKGQVYMSHMDYDPGNKLRIRIVVAPAD